MKGTLPYNIIMKEKEYDLHNITTELVDVLNARAEEGFSTLTDEEYAEFLFGVRKMSNELDLAVQALAQVKESYQAKTLETEGLKKMLAENKALNLTQQLKFAITKSQSQKQILDSLVDENVTLRTQLTLHAQEQEAAKVIEKKAPEKLTDNSEDKNKEPLSDLKENV